MPFKSEAQRKYLWANEPEIARDWTDTYGSEIQAAHGGLIGSVGGTSRQKYQQGNMVGAEMEGAEMEGAVMESQEVIKELYDAFIAQGLSPQAAMEKIKEIIASSQAEGPESPMMGEEFPGQEFGGGPRAPAAFGGIMDTYTGRRKYGLGSFIKKAFKKVKKLAKSPIGKAALMYVATAGLGNLAGGLGGATKWGNMFGKAGWMKPSTIGANWLGKAGAWKAPKGIGPLDIRRGGTHLGSSEGILGKFGLTKGFGTKMPTPLGIGTAATLAPFAMQATGNWEQDQLPGPNITGQEFDFDYGQMRKDIADAVAGGDYNEFTEVLGNYGLTEGANIPNWGTLAHGAEGGRVGYFAGGPLVKKGIDALRKFKRPIFSYDDETKMIMDLTETGKYTEKELMVLEGDQLVEIYVREGFSPPKAIPQVDETIEMKKIIPEIEKAQGGRIGRQEGGLMNLGGMEKDYRNDGGFVPIGGQEKADDVPARLSRNEFVFTADAVRNAGGGDIDKGAEVMENVMKNLEGGGKISEESQGREGARDMFEVSERLSEVV